LGPELTASDDLLVRSFPWLKKGKKYVSRFHLELSHAGTKKDTQYTFFYRNADFLKTCDEDSTRVFLAAGADERKKLDKLKQIVATNKHPVCHYSCTWNSADREPTGFEEFGRLVVEQVRKYLEKHLQRTCAFDEPSFDEVGLSDLSSGSDSDIELDLRDSAAPPAEPSPIYLDENVQFTVHRPKVVEPERWHQLLAFAHLSEKRPDAPAHEPDPVQEVKIQASRILGESIKDYQATVQDSLHAVPHDGEITFVPELKGFKINPERRTFRWVESVHREEFRLWAPAAILGQTKRGHISVFLGSILLADIPLVIKVDHVGVASTHEPIKEVVTAQPYRKIFASYSHKDLAIVEQFERHVQPLGDEYLRDWKHLRAGQKWNDELRNMIRQADVFQLFWSSNSIVSTFCRQEWEYALSLDKSHFVRPTYWEKPMPVLSNQQLPPRLADVHFHFLGFDFVLPSAAEQPAVVDEPLMESVHDDLVLRPTRKPKPIEEEDEVNFHIGLDLIGPMNSGTAMDSDVVPYPLLPQVESDSEFEFDLALEDLTESPAPAWDAEHAADTFLNDDEAPLVLDDEAPMAALEDEQPLDLAGDDLTLTDNVEPVAAWDADAAAAAMLEDEQPLELAGDELVLSEELEPVAAWDADAAAAAMLDDEQPLELDAMEMTADDAEAMPLEAVDDQMELAAADVYDDSAEVLADSDEYGEVAEPLVAAEEYAEAEAPIQAQYHDSYEDDLLPARDAGALVPNYMPPRQAAYPTDTYAEANKEPVYADASPAAPARKKGGGLLMGVLFGTILGGGALFAVYLLWWFAFRN